MLVPCLAAQLVGPATLPGEDDPEELFGEAVGLAAERRHEEAVALMEQVRSANPDHPDVLWNLGLWYADLDRHEDALRTWKRYREVAPDDWRGRAKLIQTYQALGRQELRDEERAALLDWHGDLAERQRPEQDLFCREQFRVGEQRVMAFEYFRPAGERRVFLRFSLLDAGGEETAWYSLGSYDLTNDIARATGEIGEGDELYHLDRYDEGSHSTLAFFKRMPTYETVRQHVVAALQGDLKPISSFR
jgi:tetratricopeptide (TPR) repeat protein